MAATTRRMSAATTPAERKAAVEDMLREIAYVLHVTRRVSRDIDWPVAAPARKPKPRAVEAVAAVAAV